tara:strand:+ start:6226 stop:6666 length:441 start_codon:yes stop_codon:yes gene_type:complete
MGFNLGDILKIAVPAVAGYAFGGGSFAGASIGSSLIKSGAQAFIDSQGGQGQQSQGFISTTVAPQARSLQDLTAGTRAATRAPQLTQSQNPVYQMPEVQTAFTNLLNNARNDQVRRMLRENGYDVQPTAKQGRRTAALEAPKVEKV